MTLTEAIVAIAILAGLVAGCFEAFKMAAVRVELAHLETQVTTDAEAILQQEVSIDQLSVSAQSGVTAAGTHWTRTAIRMEAPVRSPMPYQVEVVADLSRGSVSIRKTIATVRLVWSHP